MTVGCAARITTLLFAVLIIVMCGSEEKMIRIATRWIIAFVEHQKVSRIDWSVCENPRQPIGSQWRPIHVELTVPARFQTTSSPIPTLVVSSFGHL